MFIKYTNKLSFNSVKVSFTLFYIMMLLGCSGMDVLERDFGKSVKMMEQTQIYDKNAATNPSPDAPEGISGNKSLADLNKLERPITAEKQMLNYIKAKKFDVGDK